MKRQIRSATGFNSPELADFSDRIAEQFPYKFHYTVDNSSWGSDFQRRAEKLGCIKVEGRYKGRYQPMIFYLAPSEDAFDELRKLNTPTIHMNSIHEYTGSDDYILTNIFTSCPQQKELRKLMRARI